MAQPADTRDERDPSTPLDTDDTVPVSPSEGPVPLRNSAVETLQAEENQISNARERARLQFLEEFREMTRRIRAANPNRRPEVDIFDIRRPQSDMINGMMGDLAPTRNPGMQTIDRDTTDLRRERTVLNVLREQEERVRIARVARSGGSTEGSASTDFDSESDDESTSESSHDESSKEDSSEDGSSDEESSDEDQSDSTNILVLWRSPRGECMRCYVCLSRHGDSNTPPPDPEYLRRVCISIPRPGGHWELDYHYLVDPPHLASQCLSHRLYRVWDNSSRVLLATIPLPGTYRNLFG